MRTAARISSLNAASFTLSALSALLATGCEGTSRLPDLHGRLVNHTPFDTRAFEISATLDCVTRDLMGWRKSCGRATRTVHPEADGSFTIPAMDSGSAIGASYEFKVSVLLPEQAGTAGLSGARRVAYYDFLGDGFKDIPKLSSITAFYLPEQELVFRPSSGRDSLDWARTSGRDSDVRFEMSFGEKLTENWRDPLIHGWSEGTLEKLPAQIRFVAGNFPENAPVTVKATLLSRKLKPGCLNDGCELASFTRTVPFSPVLDATVRTFSFDDSSLPLLNKAVDGRWKSVFNFHRNYSPGLESDMYDAGLELRCVDGALSGTAHLVNRPASPRKFDGVLPVAGTCDGESGVIQLRFQYANDVPEQDLTIRYDRIAGVRDSLVSGELDRYDTGAYTFNLLIRDQEGKGQGRVTIDRAD